MSSFSRDSGIRATASGANFVYRRLVIKKRAPSHSRYVHFSNAHSVCVCAANKDQQEEEAMHMATQCILGSQLFLQQGAEHEKKILA